MENYKIQYQGFSPSQFTRDYVQTLMDKIRDEAPSGATVRMQIKKIRERTFKGVVTITSQAGSFFATASHPILLELGHELLERIRRDLDRWKSNRFRTKISAFPDLPKTDEFLLPRGETVFSQRSG